MRRKFKRVVEVAKREKLRIMIYKPAVTRVDEWTRDEMGVGAAIAAGSHGEKGKRADFVERVRIRKKEVIREVYDEKKKERVGDV